MLLFHQSYRILAPAKLNLYLKIVGRRPDGLHELDTLMQSLDWGDELFFRFYGDERNADAASAAPRHFRLADLGEPDYVPLNAAARAIPWARNILASAWRYLVSSRGGARLSFAPSADGQTQALVAPRADSVPPAAPPLFPALVPAAEDPLADVPAPAQSAHGLAFQIALMKRIPSQAGLGGGSSDAAALLRFFNGAACGDLGIQASETAAIGADIPFLMTGGTVRCRGIGERLEPIPNIPALPVAVLKPLGIGHETRAAYARCDACAAQGHLPTPQAEAFLRACRSGDYAAWRTYGGNAFEVVLNGAERTNFEALRRVAYAEGALLYGLSGSGSARFAIFQDSEARGRFLRRLSSGCEVYAAHLSPVAYR